MNDIKIRTLRTDMQNANRRLEQIDALQEGFNIHRGRWTYDVV